MYPKVYGVVPEISPIDQLKLGGTFQCHPKFRGRKRNHVGKTQAYVSHYYMSGSNIPKSCSSEQHTLVHFNLSRVKKGEMDLKSVHGDPGHSVSTTWD